MNLMVIPFVMLDLLFLQSMVLGITPAPTIATPIPTTPTPPPTTATPAPTTATSAPTTATPISTTPSPTTPAPSPTTATPAPTTSPVPTPSTKANPNITASPTKYVPVAPIPYVNTQPTLFLGYQIFTSSGNILYEFYSGIYTSSFANNANSKWTYISMRIYSLLPAMGNVWKHSTPLQVSWVFAPIFVHQAPISNDFTNNAIIQTRQKACLTLTPSSSTLQVSSCHQKSPNQWLRLALTSPLQPNTDYVGQDLSSTSQPTATKCYADCAIKLGCLAFVWTRNNGGTCWLKSGTANTISNSNAIAGTVTPPNVAVCSRLSLMQQTDFKGFDITSVGGATPNDCCVLCASLNACTAFSWKAGVCYLKSAAQTSLSNSLVTSSFVSKCSLLQANVDFPGNDIGSAPATMPKSCCGLCRLVPNCKAFSWSQASGGTCWFKSSRSSSATRNTGVYSAFVIL
ncbi:carbohydrate-binding protein [Thraustotheca clavata]|uniref:Carbohydrate-binding protein n=1 Tax=Thraustotheca clavata TaxID=74557 RepID=A0A1V9ZCI3_9STRA|nr:carbohydrate-binding protein [Thraustotheca clavata]